MLVCQPASELKLLSAVELERDVSFVVLIIRRLTMPIPEPVGTVEWQARHRAPFELSTTKKYPAGSVFCTCGLWQLPHSTFPSKSCTAGLAVDGEEPTNDGNKFGAETRGRIKLNGCVVERSVPSISPGYQLPVIERVP